MDDAAATGARSAGWRAWFDVVRRRPVGVLAAMAMLVLGIAGAGLGGATNRTVEQSVEPEAAMLVADGDSVLGPPPPIQEPRASQYEEVLGLATLGRTMVAVGQRAPRPRGARPDLAEPLAWWSTDKGGHWHAASTPGKGPLTAVAAGRDGFVAVGQTVDDLGVRSVVLASADRVIAEDGTRTPLVVRSSDRGDTWRTVSLPGAALTGPDSRANACAFVSGSLAVVGATMTEDGYDRAFVLVETNEGWEDVDLLEPSDVWPGHSVAMGVVAMGSDLTVVGEMTLDDSGSDLALWHGAPGRWVRLDALEELGSGAGAGGAFAVMASSGAIVVGGTASDRAVVWRTSPDRARRPNEPTTVPVPPARGSGDATVVAGDPTGEAWLLAHRSTNACELADPDLLRTVLGAEPVAAPVTEPAGPVIECRWRPGDGTRFVSIELSPAHRLDTFESTYPFVVGSRRPISGTCQEARYYGAVLTAVARCGDTAVAVGGLAQEEATLLLEAVARHLRR